MKLHRALNVRLHLLQVATARWDEGPGPCLPSVPPSSGACCLMQLWLAKTCIARLQEAERVPQYASMQFGRWKLRHLPDLCAVSHFDRVREMCAFLTAPSGHHLPE